jgi:hypothetical protein
VNIVFAKEKDTGHFVLGLIDSLYAGNLVKKRNVLNLATETKEGKCLEKVGNFIAFLYWDWPNSCMA